MFTICYDKEFDRFQGSQNEDDEEMDDSRDTIEIKRDYAIEKLNGAFEFFSSNQLFCTSELAYLSIQLSHSIVLNADGILGKSSRKLIRCI